MKPGGSGADCTCTKQRRGWAEIKKRESKGCATGLRLQDSKTLIPQHT